ncbi:sensor histidine kinase [Streptomyces sp. NPDC092369]|uniref:sensor histidine kinase n=1 Tax=Streptomyces sp. NPDC092369 TaxID=3366015 RepID=UPI003830F273
MPMRLPSPLRPITAGVPARLLPRRVRMRLTVLFGLLFVASGAVLLAITYFLVSRRKGNITIFNQGVGGLPMPDGGRGGMEVLPGQSPPPWAEGVARELREQAVRQHALEMHHLLVQSGIALAMMVGISIVLSWLVAGRIVRPLRTMTSTIRQISARNVHERLDAKGPSDELKDLADTVDGLLGRLQTALDSHKRFVANAAHELRTPLTLEHALLEEALMDDDTDTFRTTFDRLLVISRQQARLLESLLTLSSSERGVEHPEPLDLAALAEDVLLSFETEIDRRGLTLETDIRPTGISGDPALIQRLVANLLDNAIDYNLPAGRVEMATGTDPTGRPFVSVSNSGNDIPPEQVDRLLEPFQRLVRTPDDGHHGLGLSIVRAIVTAHGAELVARARPGGGLVMETYFPGRVPAPPTGIGQHPARKVVARL